MGSQPPLTQGPDVVPRLDEGLMGQWVLRGERIEEGPGDPETLRDLGQSEFLPTHDLDTS